VATGFLPFEHPHHLLGHALRLIQLTLGDSAGLQKICDFLIWVSALHLLHEPLKITHHIWLISA
jgi:hypothetical protein